MVSLIVATLNRVTELERLLSSLDQQTHRDFEVFIVDQNPDERLAPILAAHPGLPIHHLRSGRGLSHGRNVALPLTQGELICFPDDDCWYPPDLLSSVVAWFPRHTEYAGLFTCLRDADGSPVGPKWPTTACVCDRENLWRMSVSAACFLRRSAVDSLGGFNEAIGIGSGGAFQSGEDIDYSLRALQRGFRLCFEPGLTVHHPSLHDPERLRRTTYGYAMGGGYVQRIHGYGVTYLLSQVGRSLGGAALNSLKLDFAAASIYLLRARGQLRGYFWGP